MNRNEAVFFLENVLACYCGNSIAAFGLTENRNNGSKAVNYGFYIKEGATQTAKDSRECFASKNNLHVTEQNGAIIYRSK